jgi:putative alpha-1,2-mannosidase
LTIESAGNGPDHPYIQSVTWNGKPYRKSWFAHADIKRGGTFVFQMGAQPNAEFGKKDGERPPSSV